MISEKQLLERLNQSEPGEVISLQSIAEDVAMCEITEAELAGIVAMAKELNKQDKLHLRRKKEWLGGWIVASTTSQSFLAIARV